MTIGYDLNVRLPPYIYETNDHVRLLCKREYIFVILETSIE